MDDLLRDLGAFAGLAAFLGLAVLALLYFAQARDVRRLRESAEFLVEGEGGEAPPAPAPIGAEEADEETTQARGTPPPRSDAEAFRRSELARQAANRRERFEERRRGGGEGFEIPSTAVIVIGALILAAGVAFGASRLLGGDDEGGGGGGGAKQDLACRPADTQVAVLNGTGEPGLAAQSVPRLEQRGYEVRPVTNTISPFDSSVVMFDRGGQECAPEVGELVGISATEAMDQENLEISEGATVAVVLGEDQVGGGTSTDGTDTTGTLGD
jgi:LytR cell envelope-related transcriptional attenuator